MTNDDYYRRNAQAFFDDSVGLDVAALRAAFARRLAPGAAVLDAGCGSGRDAKAFHASGFAVSAFDASAELARMASAHCGFTVEHRTFASVREVAAYDGIWCCASLLHVPPGEMPDTLARLWRALRPGGWLYVSFKLGGGERHHEGRTFTDADDSVLRGWLSGFDDVETIETWITKDERPGRAQHWLNALVRRAPRGM